MAYVTPLEVFDIQDTGILPATDYLASGGAIFFTKRVKMPQVGFSEDAVTGSTQQGYPIVG
jgi:hypothetical protein